jgi:hypothetical protein
MTNAEKDAIGRLLERRTGMKSGYTYVKMPKLPGSDRRIYRAQGLYGEIVVEITDGMVRELRRQDDQLLR